MEQPTEQSTEHKVVYTSDLHGNQAQYLLLEDHVKQVEAKTLILGGDLLPKGFGKDIFVERQQAYIRKELLPFFRQLKEQCPDMQIFLIMGNDDAAINLDELMKGHPDIFQIIHQTRARITDKFEIVGYPFVPLTHVRLKDWDKYDYDMSEEDIPERFRAGHGLRVQEQGIMWGEPLRSAVTKKYLRPWKQDKRGIVPYPTEELRAAGHISDDLANPVFTKNPGGTVYVMHAPPYGTHLDLNKAGHVGSIAERLFIEQQQPFLTLHGHIHSTVDRSGEFKELIGRTVSIASGNSPKHKDSLRLVEFNLHEPEKAERKIVSSAG